MKKLIPVICMTLLTATACLKNSDKKKFVEDVKNSNGASAKVEASLNIDEPNHKFEDFYVLSRKHNIKQFKCTQCHSTQGNLSDKMGHKNITQPHGHAKDLTCFSCHSKVERDYLTNIKGEKIDMDQSYLVCKNCHSGQFKDWKGGAHGKRHQYWAGKRVINNCTTCHNPHQPNFNKRWPKTYSKPMEH